MQKEVGIAIVGGGISGLALGCFLKKEGFQFKIFERMLNEDDQLNQGFSLTIHESVEKILQQYGLSDLFKEHGTRVEAQVIFDSKGYTIKSDGPRNLVLTRKEIRKILLAHLDKDDILYDMKVIDVEDNVIVCETSTTTSNDAIIFAKTYSSIYPTTPKEYAEALKCAIHSRYSFASLVICDGIHSKLRDKLLPNFKLSELGLMNIYGIVTVDPTIHHPSLEVQVLDGFHRLFCKPYENDKQMWEFTYPFKETDTLNFQSSKQELLEHVCEIIKLWPFEEAYSFIKPSESKDIIVHNLADHVPEEEELLTLPKNIHLIGDTIHPMGPFIGKGANEAITDAYQIVRLLKSEITLAQFNTDLIDRGKASVTKSRTKAEFYHSKKCVE